MGHNAVLLCTAVGSPPPIISWVRDMMPIDTTNPRYTVLDTGKSLFHLHAISIFSAFTFDRDRDSATSKIFDRDSHAGNNGAKLGGACHISSSTRVRKSLSTRGSVDRVVTRYGNIQHIHLVSREQRTPALLRDALCSALCSPSSPFSPIESPSRIISKKRLKIDEEFSLSRNRSDRWITRITWP